MDIYKELSERELIAQVTNEEKVKELIALIESDELASDEEALKNEEPDG